MIKVVGIRFRKAGKIYYFDPGTIEIKPGQHVIVETVRGVEYGTAVLGTREIVEDEVVQPLKKVIRITTEEDDALEVKNKEREREAYEVCLTKIRKHELNMKLIDCEYTFDNNKLLFYFTADGRIDFRELVKDLASVFKTRIELRQIGVRDETKMIGSIGICGRTLCCHAHLSDFHPVSIKMAKEQNLSLNPTKISGVCGRLMCCLKYEEETYEMLNKNLPRIGASVTIRESGLRGEVIKTNIIRQRVKLVVRKEDGETEVVEMKLDELEIKGQRHRNTAKVSKEDNHELKKLERLEKEEKGEQQDKPKRRNNNTKRNNNNRNKNNDNKPKNNDQKNNDQKNNDQKQGQKPNQKQKQNKPGQNKQQQNKQQQNKQQQNKQQQNKPGQNKGQQNKPNKSNAKPSGKPEAKKQDGKPEAEGTNKPKKNNNNKNRSNRNRRNRSKKPNTNQSGDKQGGSQQQKPANKPANKAKPSNNKPSGGDA